MPRLQLLSTSKRVWRLQNVNAWRKIIGSELIRLYLPPLIPELAHGCRPIVVISGNVSQFFCSTLADFAGGASALASLEASISRWEALLDQVPVLSEERQAGLFGELWFLGQLIGQHGDIAVQSWTGPTRQAHDFRIGNFEFEVKTTNSSKRVHTINGLGQLEPSPDCTLYLISIQVADAGSGGETLADQIDAIANLIASESAKSSFSVLLERAGYLAKDAALYPKRRRLRSEPTAIRVIDGVPRLTNAAIAGISATYAPALISGVIYNIDVSGLGVPEGHSDFRNVIQCISGGVEE